ncbi:N-formylglutamate amidohydrolase [Isoalcanivorax indicus]|uniref:N-formylglutamate amidohydrolase n=1 Tax=Isoalcanivorax indicus TaxID=2202653 RepID=UPI001B876706|nr:N-formylglutamate amidohydrolase [Isoalcanivorax indicus]
MTCEHGGNRVPEPYRYLFEGEQDLLASHRGFDPGALTMAQAMATHFRAPLLASTVSRLVVDLNRSIGHRHLHRQAIFALAAEVRQEIVARFYHPYRLEARRLVAQGVARRGRVVHVSCHSFTDNLDGVLRRADIGLLYDPARPGERALCARWKSVLRVIAPELEVRRNFPYEGRNDGMTTWLRTLFPPDHYLGIELELNQSNVLHPARTWTLLRRSLVTSLNTVLGASAEALP